MNPFKVVISTAILESFKDDANRLKSTILLMWKLWNELFADVNLSDIL